MNPNMPGQQVATELCSSQCKYSNANTWDAFKFYFLIMLGFVPHPNLPCYNYDTDASSRDVLDGQGLASQDLWFTRSGNTLVVDVVGSDDQVRVSNWFGSSHYQLDEVRAGDAALYNAQVEQLVNAMAAFDVPSGVGAVVPQNVQDDLAPALAVSWQAA